MSGTRSIGVGRQEGVLEQRHQRRYRLTVALARHERARLDRCHRCLVKSVAQLFQHSDVAHVAVLMPAPVAPAGPVAPVTPTPVAPVASAARSESLKDNEKQRVATAIFNGGMVVNGKLRESTSSNPKGMHRSNI